MGVGRGVGMGAAVAAASGVCKTAAGVTGGKVSSIVPTVSVSAGAQADRRSSSGHINRIASLFISGIALGGLSKYYLFLHEIIDYEQAAVDDELG